MKIFSWVQSKINGKHGNNGNNGNQNPIPFPFPAPKPASVPSTRSNQIKQEQREEFSDWPGGLLSIGTFGNNNNVREPETRDDPDDIRESPTSSPDLSDFTPEEVGKLQRALTKLLSRKPASHDEKEPADLPLERFLNCPSSLEVDRRLSERLSCESFLDKDQDDIERTINIIIGKCKEIRADRSKKDIGKKSMSFLFRKIFVCAGGFSPMLSLRDPLPESRMEKVIVHETRKQWRQFLFSYRSCYETQLLRTILRKKMYPQSNPRSSMTKKYLEDGPSLSMRTRKEEKENMEEGSKWVKTDSDYIVLEI
ncbi:hypothetical protein MLD38_028976 [Melastoma candidum]|uniref:Uncharacterized protein n=1 Tax=Melastoma candidum TaxID=119954 RepID=A0ACB9N478_9MYRT|nr:hypothetical protein MLD38_028976 [Melastoma candidum]